MEKIFHPYHIVNISPWPLITGLAVLRIVLGIVKIFAFADLDLVFCSFILILIVVSSWWRDVIRERGYQGFHTGEVVRGLILGMVLFIIREIFFFLSFFWSFFHSSLNSTLELGGIWPPIGIERINAFQVPLLNTVILLGSGISVTWCHQRLLNKDLGGAKNSLIITWLLGGYFLILQGMEYNIAIFSFRDSVFGSVFYIATGFHGFHVVVGRLFLFVIWLRMLKVHFREGHHLGFEFAAWYWHFVDVVWLFLFSVVYWWGG